MIVRLHPKSLEFPDPATALGPDSDAPGLLAIGGDLRPERIVAAYTQGIFPWFREGQPPLWWSPDPRMVLQVAHFKLHPSLRKRIRRFLKTPGCEVRVSHAPGTVIQACATSRREGQGGGTWIVPGMVAAYTELARRGVVHSVETWCDGQLIGGLYGVRLGRMFFGESMFARATDASKIALAFLVGMCRRDGIPWIDCQQNTRHLASLGAAEVSGAEFRAHLLGHVPLEPPTPWVYDPSAWETLL